ncbi:S-layer homology domain-containing protein [Peptococcus simiae]|uniref:S-layer homology domain-containing protein n=1 Tax=Peptococcus simiae TaxID=1643805 RepID=UPI00397F3772
MYKKILSFILALSLLLGVLPMEALAAQAPQAKETTGYETVVVNGQAYKSYRLVDLLTPEAKGNLKEAVKEASKPKVTGKAGTTGLRKSGYEIDQGGYHPQDPSSTKRWNLTIDWSGMKDLEFPKNKFEMKVAEFKGDPQRPGHKIHVKDVGRFVFDGSTFNETTKKATVEMEVLDGVDLNDYSGMAVYKCELVVPLDFRYDFRLLQGKFEETKPQGYNFHIIGAQNVMPAYTVEWHDQDASTRQAFDAIWRGRSNTVQNIKPGVMNDVYYSVDKETSDDGGGVGFVGDIISFNKDKWKEITVDSDNTGITPSITLGISKETPIAAAGSYIIQEGKVNNNLPPDPDTDYKQSPTEMQHGDITFGNTKYLFHIFGNYKYLHKFVMREALPLTFDANGGKFKESTDGPTLNGEKTQTTAQEIGHGLKLNDTFPRAIDLKSENPDPTTNQDTPYLENPEKAALETKKGVFPAAKVPSADNIDKDAIPKKDGKNQEFKGWVLEADKDLDFSVPENAAKIISPQDILTKEMTAPVTYYAAYAPKAQAKADVRYVFRTEAGGQKQVIDEKYRADADASKYPAEIEGDKDTKIDMSKYSVGIQGQEDFKAPKFIGFTYKGPEIDGANQSFADPKSATLDLVYTKQDEIIKKEQGTTVPNGYVDVTFKVADNSKIADQTDDIVYAVNPKAGVKINEGGKYELVGKDSKGNELKKDVPTVSADTGYKPNYHKKDENNTTTWAYDNYAEVGQVITEPKTFTSQVVEKGNGTAKLVYVGEQGQTLEPATDTTLQIQGQTYAPDLSGKDGADITFTRDQAPKLLGYELVEGNDAVTIAPAKYQEGQEATITLKYKKLDDVIPAEPGKDQPEGYVAVNFKDAKGAKVADKDKDVTFYVNPQAEVKVVEGDTATLVGKDGKAQNVPAVTADEGYKVVTAGDKKWPYDNHDKVGQPITTPTDFTANVAVRGNGSATLAYQDVAGNPLDPTTDALKLDKQVYNPTLTGKHNTALPTYTEANAPKIRGYKFVSQEPTDGKYNEDTPATITLKYEKRDDVIPAKPGEEKPDGYVTVTFQDVAGAKLDDKDANISYYVNPKAEKKALIELNGDKYQIKGTKADKSEFTADVPAVTADDKYEVKYTDADKKWPYNNADKLNKAIEGDVTFVAQVVKIGEPTVTYPDVEIEKGKTQEITPDAKDKHGKTVPTEKIGKVEVTEKPDGVTVTPADKGGKITVDVPKDYKGPSEFTIKVKVDLDGTPVTSEIKVKVKQPRTPGGGGGTIVIPSKPDPKPETDPSDLNKDDHYQYLIGYPDGTFAPNRGMTRAEVATMFTRLLKDRPVKGQSYTSNFTDVNAGDWYANTVGYAVQKGIVSGYPDGSFKPNQAITRAEFSAIAARFAGLTDEKDLTFTDLDASHWGYKAIRLAASHGWISGYPDNTFRPEQDITRAEVTSITNRMLNRYADLDWIDANMDKVIQFSDVARGDWFFEPIMEATMGHDFTRDADGKHEHWTGLNNESFI